MLVAVAFPLAATWAVDTWGPRAAGALVFAFGLASLALSVRVEHGSSAGAASEGTVLAGFGPWLRGLPLALPGLAALSGDVRFLKLVPAAIELVLCAVFLGSLRGGSSILQRAALTLEPFAPDFIGPYCRKATAAFATLFAVQAVALAALAFASPDPDWARNASLLVWAPTLAATALEFIVRKAWFRHYGPGFVDRALRVLLPPESTAQGRRSLDYIRKKRVELGLPPPS
jgi:uncharacterized membrane protein